ncbi:MAG: hypothetical protein QOI24_303 [Acidobacteriota bacterium]|jgi:hypothetical protein|nr:hypothetical protein [Acidobacteriota bacterium]
MVLGFDAALARAIAFLERSQLPSGEIPVGAFRAGHSARDPSVFPTAIAAHSLSFAPDARVVRERALDFLAAEMDRRGVWRHWSREHPHHRLIPPDADDTSCATAALRAVGRAVPDNVPLLLANRDRRGLFRTWLLSREQLAHPLATWFFFRRTSAKPFDVDAVVNANVLFALGDRAETRPVVDHLLRVLRANEETSCDKWYEQPFAVWYFFSRALRAIAPEAGDLITARIAAATPANALESALAACALLDWNVTPDLAPLLDAQLPSGAWPRAGLYHGGRKRLSANAFAPPHPDTPWWGSEELTTSFSIEALTRGMSALRADART